MVAVAAVAVVAAAGGPQLAADRPERSAFRDGGRKSQLGSLRLAPPPAFPQRGCAPPRLLSLAGIAVRSAVSTAVLALRSHRQHRPHVAGHRRAAFGAANRHSVGPCLQGRQVRTAPFAPLACLLPSRLIEVAEWVVAWGCGRRPGVPLACGRCAVGARRYQEHGELPTGGMAVARKIGTINYRSRNEFDRRCVAMRSYSDRPRLPAAATQRRARCSSRSSCVDRMVVRFSWHFDDQTHSFEVERYLQHQVCRLRPAIS